jgi:hypothetical protein
MTTCGTTGLLLRNELYVVPDQYTHLTAFGVAHGITAADQPYIVNRAPRVGMSQCAAAAALGHPHQFFGQPPYTAVWTYMIPGQPWRSLTWHWTGQAYVLTEAEGFQSSGPPNHHTRCTRHFYNRSSFDWGVTISSSDSYTQRVPPGATVELHYTGDSDHSVSVETMIPHTRQHIQTTMYIVRDGIFGFFRACPRIDINAAMVTAPWFDVNRPAAGDIRTCEGNCY